MGFASCRRKRLACFRRSAQQRYTAQLPVSGKQLPIVATVPMVRMSKKDMNRARDDCMCMYIYIYIYLCVCVCRCVGVWVGAGVGGGAGRPLNHSGFLSF